MKINMKIILLIALTAIQSKCAKSVVNPTPNPVPPPVTNEVDFWLTKADQSVKLEKQSTVLGFGTTFNMFSNIL